VLFLHLLDQKGLVLQLLLHVHDHVRLLLVRVLDVAKDLEKQAEGAGEFGGRRDLEVEKGCGFLVLVVFKLLLS